MNQLYKITFALSNKKPVSKKRTDVIAFLHDDKGLAENFEVLLGNYNIVLPSNVIKNILKEQSSVSFQYDNAQLGTLTVYKVKLKAHNASDYFRNVLTGIIPGLSSSGTEQLHVILPEYQEYKKYFKTESYFYQSFIEGVLFGNYTFNKYKSDDVKEKSLLVSFETKNTSLCKSALAKAQSLMEGVNFTKDLQNEPGNVLTPDILAKTIKAKIQKAGIKVTVFDEKEIAKRKMGGLLAVGSGSKNPPRFLKCEYTPSVKSTKKKPLHVVLVGKGITFDSGGISIKPASGMGEMKADMSGAAVVAGTLLAASNLNLPIRITGIIPSAENMPSGSSMRPGDIVTTSSGKTIEVDNTDAEGRVILSDALHFASQLKPDVIIDLATLTGACVVALGEFVAGLFTQNDVQADKLYQSGLRTFDRVWRLPLWDDFSMLIKSDVADVKNLGGRWGGAIAAAKFLENWVNPDIPWVHLDIAGPAFPNSISNYSKTFMTGFGVRLLIDYLEEEVKK